MSDRFKKVKIEFIQAKDLFVDPEDVVQDFQRHPEERIKQLKDIYGENGEKFSPEHCGALKVKPRGRGRYAIKDGGGRWWVVMNLLNKPNLRLPCVLMEDTSDLEAFVVAQTSVRVPPGKVFMARGNDPKNTYEHRVCNVIKEFGFTVTPGKKVESLKLLQVIFGYDLGVLRTALTLAKEYWGERRIEGLALAGLIGFLYTFKDKPGFSMDRLKLVLNNCPFNDLKDSARQFLPKNKKHQRQWGHAMAREIVIRYNLGTSKIKKLDHGELSILQERVQDMKHYGIFSQVWEMRKKI